MACSAGDPLNAVKGFFAFLGDPIGSIVEGIANAVLAAAISVFGALTTQIPTLSTGDSASEISAQTQWIVVYSAVGSLIYAAIRMALERRGESGQVALKGLLRVILVAGAGTAVATALANLSDRFADHLFQRGAQEQIASIGCGGGNAIEAFLLLVLSFLLLIAGIVHTILLYIRLGVMVVLLGTLPVAAAASMTDWGGGWWRKHIGWMIAWLLYKPAAALVLFSGSVLLSDTGNSDVHERIAGIGVMLLSAIALPALLKLIVPATAALGGGSASQGTTAIAGALASGAKSLGTGAAGGGDRAGVPGPVGAAGAAGAAAGAAAAAGAGAVGGAGAAAGAGARGSVAAASADLAGGPAGAAANTALNVAKSGWNVAAGALDDADGSRGHN
ncbi:hypothetical protein [Streptomyces antibioticus]|uniref:hypothetical protein n=1 Tax=Streptomyces antibioticus TaxID=1890 RepID=UPI0036D8172C